jgi:hypothetical protein
MSSGKLSHRTFELTLLDIKSHKCTHFNNYRNEQAYITTTAVLPPSTSTRIAFFIYFDPPANGEGFYQSLYPTRLKYIILSTRENGCQTKIMPETMANLFMYQFAPSKKQYLQL